MKALLLALPALLALAVALYAKWRFHIGLALLVRRAVRAYRRRNR